MAWSTVALGGNSIFARVGAVGSAVPGFSAAASDGAGDDAGVSVGVVDCAAGVSGAGAGGVSGGGAEAVLPPHAANPNNNGSTNAPALWGSDRMARNWLDND